MAMSMQSLWRAYLPGTQAGRVDAKTLHVIMFPLPTKQFGEYCQNPCLSGTKPNTFPTLAATAGMSHRNHSQGTVKLNTYCLMPQGEIKKNRTKSLSEERR